MRRQRKAAAWAFGVIGLGSARQWRSSRCALSQQGEGRERDAERGERVESKRREDEGPKQLVEPGQQKQLEREEEEEEEEGKEGVQERESRAVIQLAGIATSGNDMEDLKTPLRSR